MMLIRKIKKIDWKVKITFKIVLSGAAWLPQRTDFSPGKQNISSKPLRIKLGIFKYFAKTLNKDSVAFNICM